MKDFQHPLFDEVYFYEKLISTSNQAAKMIKDQTAQGNFLIISNEQTGGKGRGNNSWTSPPGGIWMNAALYGLTVTSNITIFTGICIHKALSELFPKLKDDLKIKWPNDILFKGKKLCGILSSQLSSSRYHLIGIGINTNIDELPAEISDIATSISNNLCEPVDNIKIVQKIFDILAADLPQLIETGFDLQYFKAHSFLKGKIIVLNTDYDRFSGTCKGINKNGAILLELKSGMIQPFFAGSVVKWT